MTSRLDKLLQKEAQLKAQIQLAKAAERTLERKRDTRRKILIGAAVMARVEHGAWPEADLKLMMDGFLTRPNERELFGLEAEADELAVGAQAEAQVKREKTKAKTMAKAKTQRSEVAGKQKAERSPAGLAEPDFDVDKEFNL